METTDCECIGGPLPPPPDSLFERCAWFYALCREYLFRDHTHEIANALFSPAGPAPDTHVVELGCGPGFYACRLAEEYPQIRTTGIDLSERLLLRAKLRAARKGLSNCAFTRGDVNQLPQTLGRVDAVVVSRLFLIVPEREAVVREIFRILRPGGRCFIAEPTSGFRTSIPLVCMQLLAKFPRTAPGSYREPRQAEVMKSAAFAALIRSQPWVKVELDHDDWYQYAVCRKSEVASSVHSSGKLHERGAA
jgi:arsenite methyltransferase